MCICVCVFAFDGEEIKVLIGPCQCTYICKAVRNAPRMFIHPSRPNYCVNLSFSSSSLKFTWAAEVQPPALTANTVSKMFCNHKGRKEQLRENTKEERDGSEVFLTRVFQFLP